MFINTGKKRLIKGGGYGKIGKRAKVGKTKDLVKIWFRTLYNRV